MRLTADPRNRIEQVGASPEAEAADDEVTVHRTGYFRHPACQTPPVAGNRMPCCAQQGTDAAAAGARSRYLADGIALRLDLRDLQPRGGRETEGVVGPQDQDDRRRATPERPDRGGDARLRRHRHPAARCASFPETLYAAAVKRFGTRGVAEIAYISGCYAIICNLLNVFDVAVPLTEGADTSA